MLTIQRARMRTGWIIIMNLPELLPTRCPAWAFSWSNASRITLPAGERIFAANEGNHQPKQWVKVQIMGSLGAGEAGGTWEVAPAGLLIESWTSWACTVIDNYYNIDYVLMIQIQKNTHFVDAPPQTLWHSALDRAHYAHGSGNSSCVSLVLGPWTSHCNGGTVPLMVGIQVVVWTCEQLAAWWVGGNQRGVKTRRKNPWNPHIYTRVSHNGIYICVLVMHV